MVLLHSCTNSDSRLNPSASAMDAELAFALGEMALPSDSGGGSFNRRRFVCVRQIFSRSSCGSAVARGLFLEFISPSRMALREVLLSRFCVWPREESTQSQASPMNRVINLVFVPPRCLAGGGFGRNLHNRTLC